MATHPPPRRPPWTLLQRHPRFHDGGITVDLTGAPATSSLSLPRHRVDGTTTTPPGLPYVLAADNSGALLLSFTSLGDVQARPDLAVLRVDKDKGTITLRKLPPRNPPLHPIHRTNAIGFMPTSRTRTSTTSVVDYTVAEIQFQDPIPGSDTGLARLITASTQGGDWAERELLLPASHARRPWGRDGVFSNDGRICWCDLTWGLVLCDPVALVPNLVFVKLPDGSTLDFDDHPAVEGRRSLSVSGSHVRYLEISRVGDGPSRITCWTLQATATRDAATVWNWDKTAGAMFQDICAGESYARTRLPKTLPKIAAISPLDPNLICFQQDQYLVGLHLHTNTVAWVAHRYPGDQIAWQIPHSFMPSGADTYPGAIGSLVTTGFECTFTSSSPNSTYMQIKVFSPKASISIKLWHRKYPIRHLSLVEQFAGSGSVIYSSDADADTSPVIVPSFRHFLLFAPIPHFDLVFNLFGISPDVRTERQGIVEECFSPSGRKRLMGSLQDENNRVLFIEHDGIPNPILILECRLGDIQPFGIQLTSYLPCHSLSIKKSGRISAVSLKLKADSTELKTTTLGSVSSYIPIPYLARVAALFR